MKYLLLVLAFCAGMVVGYWKQTQDHPAFCSELEQRLYNERLRHHGIDKRGNSVWREDGVYKFKCLETGREGKFI